MLCVCGDKCKSRATDGIFIAIVLSLWQLHRSAFMAKTTLTLSSKNYSSWSLRGWLMVKLSGISFSEVMVATDNVDARAELLLLSPSILVPCLNHGSAKVWDT